MKLCASVLLFAGLLFGQSLWGQTAGTELEFTGSPLKLPYTCAEDDLQWAGLSCGDAPCAIYIDLLHATAQGKTILITGDFHAANATMFSLLLRSDDSGRTWREPYARIRGAELDAIQLYDAQTGWISGQIQQPLALDPFFLLTIDGGRNWTRVPLFEEEGTPGAIVQFVFTSRDDGLALVDHGGGEMRYEVFETQSGGRTWSMRQKSDSQPALKPLPEPEWRMHPEPKLFRLEHLEEGRWSPFASFATAAAECRETPHEPEEPKEPEAEEAVTTGKPKP